FPAVVLGLTLPEEGDLVRQPALDMAVDAVEADVELAAKKPLGVRGLPLVELGPGFEEGDPLRLGRPEVVDALAVDVRLGVGLLAERGVWAIPALLHLEGLDGVPARAHITHRPSMRNHVPASPGSSLPARRGGVWGGDARPT